MMDMAKRKYYLNIAPHADRQVHCEECIHLPPPDCRKYLGEFYSPMSAVVEALKTHPVAHSCETCS